MEFADPEEAIGEKLNLEYTDGQIIGVVKDFHFSSLHNDIEPLILEVRPGAFKYYGIRISNSEIPQTIAFIESHWGDFFPGKVFEYFFLDEAFDRQYKQEDQLAQVLTVFALVILIISGIGLFGLIAFMATSRTKEVGIRKTLGASVGQIVYLFVKEFIFLVLLGNVLAIPLILYFGSDWLNNFAYRTDINPSIFIYSIMITMVLSLVLISIKTLKTARMNPVMSLRYE